MPTEVPIQVDLSQDSDWDQVDDSLLTQDDKNILKAHFTEETEGIIYLTRQELSELKSTLDTTNLSSLSPEIQAGTIAWDIDAFVDGQLQEWLATSEVIGWDNELFSADRLDQLDELSQELLFWNEGVFEGMNISPTAQDHIAVALSLSIIHTISNNANMTTEEIIALLSGSDITLVNNVNTSLDGLRGVISGFVEMEDDIDANFLNIAGNWEGNNIFMQTETWVEFFNALLSWELSEEDIESRIESENADESDIQVEWIPNNLLALHTSTNMDINNISEALQDSVSNASAGEFRRMREQIQADTPEQERTGIAKIIYDILKSIFDAIWEFSWDQDTNWGTDDNPLLGNQDSAPDESPDSATDIISQLQDLQVPGFDLSALWANPENMSQIQDILEDLSPETTAQQEFEHLFWGNGHFSEISRIFQENNSPFEAWTSETQQFITILETYKTYRVDPDVAGRNNDRTTWEEWSQENDWTQN